MKTPIQQLAKWTNAQLEGNTNLEVTSLVTDTRHAQFLPNAMFAALSGPHFNGHDYLSKAYEMGCRIFMVDQPWASRPADTTVLGVPNVLKALQDWATQIRISRKNLVIGITGSNGKTIVKEWLFQLLSKDFEVYRSPGSFNSQLGVALSILGIQNKPDVAIIEAGISKSGEMNPLQKMIQPDMVILTHMGTAHQEGFSSFREKIREKLKLAEKADVLVYHKDQKEVDEEVQRFRADRMIQVVSWSWHTKATLQVIQKEIKGYFTQLTILYKSRTLQVDMPFTDEASIENAMTCLSALLPLERFDQLHFELFSTLNSVSMRLELKEGWNNITLINDAYSADIHGFKAALDFMSRHDRGKKRVVIFTPLSDVPERLEEYHPLLDLFNQYQIQHIYTIGGDLHFLEDIKTLPLSRFNHVSQFLQNVRIHDLANSTVLIKGGRKYGLEKIGKWLEKKSHSTCFTVNLGAIAHNLGVFRKHVPVGTKLMAMIKAFGYGSGSFELGRLLQHLKVDYLGVAYADEGIALRKDGITLPIMVMNPEPHAFHLMQEYSLEPVIYSHHILDKYIQYCKESPLKNIQGIHIELDTGMHRLGFMPDEISLLNLKIQEQTHFNIISIFSHLAGSDESEQDAYSHQQYHDFIKNSQKIQQETGFNALLHLQNTAGMSRFQWEGLHMARLGLGLHGIDTGQTLQSELEPAFGFYSVLSQIKNIPAGEGISYNRRTVTTRQTRIGIIAAGYADGIPRLLGKGKGYVYIQGQAFPIVGEVCMDMCMVDLSDAPESVQEGEKVIFFENAEQLIQMAIWADTIPYEILTGISPRVSRLYLQE